MPDQHKHGKGVQNYIKRSALNVDENDTNNKLEELAQRCKAKEWTGNWKIELDHEENSKTGRTRQTQ